MDLGLSKLQELVMDKAWCAAIHEVATSWRWLRDWTELRTELEEYLKISKWLDLRWRPYFFVVNF